MRGPDETRAQYEARFQKLFPGVRLCEYDGVCEKGGQQLIEMYFDGRTPMESYWLCEEHGNLVMAELGQGGASVREAGELPDPRSKRRTDR